MRSLLISFFSFLKKEKIPNKDSIIKIAQEPLSLYTGLLILICITITSLILSIFIRISDLVSVEVPDYGGTLSIGMVGAPRFINPILSVSETDNALINLVFIGLVKEKDDGSLEPVLAQNFTVSPDGREYKFTLKNNLMFSNKIPLSSSDIQFTFEMKKRVAMAIDPTNDWSLVSTEVPDNKTIIIRTSGDPQSLISKLSIGIVPKNLWEPIDFTALQDSTLNTKPVGDGPFVVKSISYSNTVPKEVLLERNPLFIGPKPYVAKIKAHIYANQLDLKSGLLSGGVNNTTMLDNVLIDQALTKNFGVQQITTTKNISLFVNQGLKDSISLTVLSVIDRYIDRNKIIDIIENGYGIPLEPLGDASATDSDIISSLEKLGYKKDESGTLIKAGAPIKISIAIKKDDELIKTANQLQKELSRFGITTELKVFEQGLLKDQAIQGQYPFILGTETDVPTGYKSLIPLYTKVISCVTTKNIHVLTPKLVIDQGEIYREIGSWYLRSNKILKWFK